MRALKELIHKLNETGFYHIFSATVLNKIIVFSASMILTRIISKQEYGIYAYADNIMKFFLLANGLGMTSSTLLMCCETTNIDKRKSIYDAGCVYGNWVNVFIGLAVFVVSQTIMLPLAGSNQLLAMMSLLPIVLFIPEMQRVFLRSNLFNRQYAYSNIVSSGLMLVFSFGFGLRWGGKGIILAQYVATVLSISYLHFYSKAPYCYSLKPSISLSRTEKTSLIKIGAISSLSAGLSQLMYLLDIFMLGIFVPDDSIIAAYKVATIIPNAMGFIPSAVMIYIYPYFVQHQTDNPWLRKKYKTLVIMLGAINCMIAGILIVGASLIIQLLFGVQYIDAVVPFRILCINFLISGTLRDISGSLLGAKRKFSANLILAFIGGGTNTILNVAMIPKLGSLGAAIATLLTGLSLSVLSTVCLLREYRK